jgi:hypothetical protein
MQFTRKKVYLGYMRLMNHSAGWPRRMLKTGSKLFLLDLPIRLVMVCEGGGVQAAVEGQLLADKRTVSSNPIRVQIGSQVVKVVAQEPDALGLAQLGVLRRGKLPELETDVPVEQPLSLVTLGDPMPKVQKIIDAARHVAKTAFERS